MTTMLRPKNQVTIPQSLIRELGWEVGDRIDFVRQNDRVVIIRETLPCTPARSTWVEAATSRRRIKLPKSVTVASLLQADREE